MTFNVGRGGGGRGGREEGTAVLQLVQFIPWETLAEQSHLLIACMWISHLVDSFKVCS